MNKLLQWINQNKIISMILIFIILTALMPQIIPQDDKKEASYLNIPGLGQVPTSSIAITGALSTSPWWVAAIPVWGWWAIGITAALFFIPNIIKSWRSAFAPQPTIPIWIWIAGFFILFMMVTRKKGGN